MFDLGLRSMEGEGEIGDWPALREEGGPGGGAEGWVLEGWGLGGRAGEGLYLQVSGKGREGRWWEGREERGRGANLEVASITVWSK